MNDYAGLLAAGERERLESLLAERERATGAQMAIAVFRSLEGESLEDVANRLFQQWRLGHKGLDNGALLVVFVEDRKVRIEVGYGLEAVLTDAEAGQIIRNAIAPSFREQRYAAGLEAAVGAVYARIAPAGGASPRQKQREAGPANLYLLAFLALAALTIGGLALEASLNRGLTASRRGWTSSGPGGWYGGGWSGGGGGGWSGGGGFSGGGGSSGGGGASGSW